MKTWFPMMTSDPLSAGYLGDPQHNLHGKETGTQRSPVKLYRWRRRMSKVTLCPIRTWRMAVHLFKDQYISHVLHFLQIRMGVLSRTVNRHARSRMRIASRPAFWQFGVKKVRSSRNKRLKESSCSVKDLTVCHLPSRYLTKYEKVHWWKWDAVGASRQ